MKSMTKNRIGHMASLIVVLALDVVEGQSRSKSLEAEAKHNLGRVATLCGRIVGNQCAQPEQTTVLVWEKPTELTGVGIAIAQSDRNKFPALVEHQFLFLNVCATGRVEKLHKRYAVRVTEPDQLQVQGGVAAPVSFDTGTVSMCDAGVVRPMVLRMVTPDYTPAAKSAGIQGVVLLEAVVLTDGRVSQIRVIHSLDAKLGLDEQAIKAFGNWRFVPGTVNGQVAPIVVNAELTFRLK
jgi:TonB family protein